MKNLIPIIIILILGILTYFLFKEPVKTTGDFDKTMFRLDSAAVSEITYEQNGKKIILGKDKGKWMIKFPGEYEPDPALKDLIVEFVTEVEVSDMISEKKEKFSKFQVDSSGIKLKVRTKDNKEISYFIGKNHSDYKHSFIRKENDNRIFLGNLFPNYRFKPDVNEWRDKSISKINKNNIKSISLSEKGKSLLLKPGPDGNWTASVNGKKNDMDNNEINKIIGLVTNFRALDFKDDLDLSDIDAGVFVDIKTTAGDINLNLGRFSDGSYLAYKKDNEMIYVISQNDYELLSDKIK